MAIDPPYRLDPLQNPVNVKWRDQFEGQPTLEGRAGVSIGTTWLFSPGHAGGGFPDGPGTMAFRTIGESEFNFVELIGVWSGGSAGTFDFENVGDGIFYPVGGGGTSGTITVVNAAGESKPGSAEYDYGGLTFVHTNTGRIFTAAGAYAGIGYDLSEVAGIPRFVTFRWFIRMVH